MVKEAHYTQANENFDSDRCLLFYTGKVTVMTDIFISEVLPRRENPQRREMRNSSWIKYRTEVSE